MHIMILELNYSRLRTGSLCEIDIGPPLRICGSRVLRQTPEALGLSRRASRCEALCQTLKLNMGNPSKWVSVTLLMDISSTLLVKKNASSIEVYAVWFSPHYLSYFDQERISEWVISVARIPDMVAHTTSYMCKCRTSEENSREDW